MPFTVQVENQDDVILSDAAPTLGFNFHDGRSSAAINQDKLLKVLSQGEKRALYILNILFEIEIRVKAEQEILIVIDDIADSFDYKNKYAIVEYLKDVASVAHFSLLLLTHNFDFHRIICSRVGVNRNNRLIAVKTQCLW